MANDDATSVVLMYIEDLVDGGRFIEIASNITGESEKRRPILALKVGESAIGAKSIASHTGALAGSQEAPCAPPAMIFNSRKNLKSTIKRNTQTSRFSIFT